jgi:hypothetical protein
MDIMKQRPPGASGNANEAILPLSPTELKITIRHVATGTKGNTTTVTVTRTTMIADDKGNFTKTTTTQTETQTKDPKTGKVDVSMGKQQQTTTSGQSDAVAAAVRGYTGLAQPTTVEGPGGSFRTNGTGDDGGAAGLRQATLSAKGESSESSDVRGMMPELADATAMDRGNVGMLFLQNVGNDAQEHPGKYVAAAATIASCDPAVGVLAKAAIRVGAVAFGIGEASNDSQ